ncbi:N-methyl-L-tryptophan oxidase [Paenibacillus endophyticus]|uniref:N-methyl-L-tryptophan oxidase n=1 Tax=Paenibacillus endophyticus TaxID=1294268 RepID=A0A7W5C4J8_9BACL|nr:N-methyl-L-tryptophan oxidase [Paenibacillus endophyticus]MBB3151038.1 N-methyl-L-tryptophan oxidase [Paenibacillus endophyticus]
MNACREDESISKSYDVIVVGAGSMGMSAGYELAARGAKPLLIDAFNPPHNMGSHHGEPRLIRHAYHGGDTYVKMALRADEKWLALERATGEKLLERSGVLNMAETSFYDYKGRLGDAMRNGVQVELLQADEINRRFPGIRLDDSFQGMYEPNAGYLYSEKCIAAYKQQALLAGAELLVDTFVTDIRADEGGVTVYTREEAYTASQVVITVGAWFHMLSNHVKLPIRAVRKVVGWFETSSTAFDAGTFPGFTWGGALGGYYGFPSISGAGIKIGRHDTGVEWLPGEPIAPFGAYPEDEDDLRRALHAFVPGAAGKLLQSAVCKYEFTPDEDFIIDAHPEHPNVLLAGGFSGHGFKFASVIGEILANKLEKKQTGYDLRIFELSRFSSQ